MGIEKKRITKLEVEEITKSNKGDFVKIDYLRRFLEQADNVEIKKFILVSLAAIYESKNMLNEAVKSVKAAGDISITFRDKIDSAMKEAELYIKIRDFEMADRAFHKAIGDANHQEKIEVQTKYYEYYKMQARIAEEQGRNRNAMEIYEKLFALLQVKESRLEIKEKLLEFYEKFGKIKEYNNLKNQEEKPRPEDVLDLPDW